MYVSIYEGMYLKMQTKKNDANVLEKQPTLHIGWQVRIHFVFHKGIIIIICSLDV